MSLRYTLFCILSLFGIQCFGVKAKPGLLKYTDKDGKEIDIKLYGDEHFNYATSPDDFLLMINEEGNYEYAVYDTKGKPVCSGIRATQRPSEIKGKLVLGKDYAQKATSINSNLLKTRQVGSSGEPKYRYTLSAFPTRGEPHSIVVLVEYQDYRFTVQDPSEYYNEFLNGDNFTKDNGTGSCRQYFIENSSGAFKPKFDVYGPVLLKNKRSFYGSGNEDNAKYMVVEAVEALDDIVDFSVYDHNDDGYVDSIYIIYADKGQADGGPVESVWPYSWELEEEGIFLEADGVKFNTYGCSNELKSGGRMEGIGVFTHEFGHVLGLPDLYNTYSSRDYSTPCAWSVMDSGSYNNDTRTPCNLSSFERYSLGWLIPEELLADGEYSLRNLADGNKAFIMTTEENEDEFYLLEHRLKEGWDEYLPGSGMLVWHIDFNQEDWDENIPNNNQSHQDVCLVRADNKPDTSSYTGDPFPGINNVTEFSNITEPGLKSWAGNDLNVTSVKNIRLSEENKRIYFDVEVTEFRGTTGIETIVSNCEFTISGNELHVSEGVHPVFDLTGRCMGLAGPGSPLTLTKGIYIINGKKIVL